MTDATQQRIDRLVGILSRECDGLDLSQITGLLTDLAQSAEAQERERALDLLVVAGKRIRAAKGRIWQQELAEAEREIRIGAQRLW